MPVEYAGRLDRPGTVTVRFSACGSYTGGEYWRHCGRGQRRKQLQPEGVTLPAVFLGPGGPARSYSTAMPALRMSAPQ
jgi:hypothetical protein